MSLFGIFGRTRSEREQAMAKYDAALQLSRATKKSFRLKAIKHIKSKYPDAVFLIHEHARNFVAYTRTGKIFLTGALPDRFYPEIEFVSSDDEPGEFIRAADQFAEAHGCFIAGTRGRDAASLQRAACGSWASEFVRDGYTYEETSEDMIVAATVSKDDTTVSEALAGNRTRHSRLASDFRDRILYDYANATGQHSLVKVRLERVINPCESTYDDVKFPYVDTPRARLEVNLRYLESIFGPVAQFLSEIEPCLAYDPRVDDEFDWTAAGWPMFDGWPNEDYD